MHKNLLGMIIALVLTLMLFSACSIQVTTSPSATPTQANPITGATGAIASPTLQLVGTATPGLSAGQATPSMPSLPPTPEQSFAVAAFQDGPFNFDFRLYRNPGFSQNPPMTWMYSDLVGVGSYVAWVYHGPELKDPVVERWGVCPDIGSFITYPLLRDGDTGAREGGFLLPRQSRPGDRVWFVFQLETAHGTYGGCIGFTIQQGAEGFEPSDVTIMPLLDQAAQNCGCSE